MRSSESFAWPYLPLLSFSVFRANGEFLTLAMLAWALATM